MSICPPGRRAPALLATPLLAAAAGAPAQEPGGAWTVANGRATLVATGISVPDRAGTLALRKTGEFSQKGKGVDTVAQFQSSDSNVFATVYAYRTTYADAALAAYATDRAIRARLGARVVLAQDGAVAFAGRPDGAIRQVFTGGMLSGQPMTSAGAFARVGGWIVKIRATGPAERGADVIAALDALIAGVTVGKDMVVQAVAPLRLAAPCPASDAPMPRLVVDRNAMANQLAGLFGGSTVETKAPIDTFPRNGQDVACVRGTVTIGGETHDMLQPAGERDPATVLLPLDDAGSVVSIEKALLGGSYTIKRYGIGRALVAGTIDRPPTAAQMTTWLETKDAPPLRIRSTTTVSAKGDTEVVLRGDATK